MQIPIESLNLLMLNVGYAQHNGDWNWKNVSSPFMRVYYVTEGEATLHLPDKTVKLKPEHLYVIRPYLRHSCECTGKFCHYYLHMFESFRSDTNIAEFYDLPVEVKAPSWVEEIFEYMCKSHSYAKLPESNPASYDNQPTFVQNIQRYNKLELYEKMNLRGCILMILSHFIQYATPHIWTSNQRLSKTLQYINLHIYENINLDDLAKVACITKSYFIRFFRKNLGMSPLQYINRKKIERAQLLLITEDITINELAYRLGFSDPSYFIRLFKKLTHSTPFEYRSTMK